VAPFRLIVEVLARADEDEDDDVGDVDTGRDLIAWDMQSLFRSCWLEVKIRL
jgi:hypothetical protein